MIEVERDTNELVERRTRPLIELDENKDVPLGRLVRFWFSLPRLHGVLPDIDHIGLMDLTRLGALGWFHIVDVQNENPARYKYNIFAQRAAGGHSGIYLSEIGSKPLKRALELDLSRAKSSRFPLFQGVRTELCSHTREYRRVALPLANGSDEVTHLLLGVHFDK